MAVVAALILVMSGRRIGLPEGDDGLYPSFAADNVYQQDVTDAPADRRSGAMVASLQRQVKAWYGGVAAFNSDRYNVSLVRADEDTPRRDVRFHDCQERGDVPEGLYDGPAHFTNVPVPTTAVPADGTDGQLTIWSEPDDALWEFWQMRQADDGVWEACWGGRLDNVSASRGIFEAPFGTSASGLVASATAITLRDLERGEIDHAVAIAIPEPAARTFSFPANRTDGISLSSDAIPEGARLRLDPSLDVDSLQLTPLAKMIAKAAQQYGLIVTDRSHGVAFVGEDSRLHREKTGEDPWEQAFGGVPDYAQMKNFPFDRLTVVEKDWGKP
ncbi:MAG: hypothetical protein Q4G51_13795 [Dermatophilus congolensis]|nr:hypothetical protein [Dermatophilus congolensis]